MKIDLDTTWISGKHEAGEINVAYSYVDIYNFFEDQSLYAQGEDANNIINDIHKLWIDNNITVNEAIKQYRNMYGY